MSEDQAESFSEAAQRNTRVCIDGAIVPVGDVSIGPTTNETGATFPLEVWIGREVLLHELNQAGESVDQCCLEEFVRNDLTENRDAAIVGYFGIVQGVLCPKKPKRIFGIFAKSHPPTKPKWMIIEVTKVSSSANSVILSGLAAPQTF